MASRSSVGVEGDSLLGEIGVAMSGTACDEGLREVRGQSFVMKTNEGKSPLFWSHLIRESSRIDGWAYEILYGVFVCI